MADPFVNVTVLNYNDDPPADDGSEVPSNRVNWATVKTEIGDPLKTAIDSLVTNTGSAVDKLMGGAGVTSTTAPYTVQTGDQGKLVRITTSGTLTTATAATVAAPFVHGVVNASSGTLTIDGASSETIDGESTITLPPGCGVILYTDGTNWFTAGRGRIQGASSFVQTLPRGYLAGCQMSNGSDSDHDIDISAGVARDTGNSFNFELSSALTKQIDASWASGTNAGGMATGVSLETDTWYHVHLVDNGSGGTDAGFDTSITAENLLATTGVGTVYRRIGSVLTDDSSNILAFVQNGDHIEWVDVNADINDPSPGTTANTGTLKTPPGVSVVALVNAFRVSQASHSLLLSSLDVTDVAPSGTANPPGATIGAGQGTSSVQARVRTDTNSQIRYRAGVNAQIAVFTLGYIDTRGRDD